MKKLFPFDAPREKYHCDSAIARCFDNRFELGLREFLKRIGVIHSDPIKIAGGAKVLASPEHESDREFVLDQIRKSIRLHSTKRVILRLRSDGRAHGGLAGGFHGDVDAEAVQHEPELHRAAANLRAAIPDVEVQGHFVDPGIWNAETGIRNRSQEAP